MTINSSVAKMSKLKRMMSKLRGEKRMNTKYEIDEIIYLPFVINRIEIEGKDYNGVGAKVKYHLVGKNAITGTYIQIDEKDTNKVGFPIKTAKDFK